MAAPRTKVEGKRVRLVKPRKAFVEQIVRYARSRDVARYTFIPKPYSLEDAEQFVRMSQRLWRTGRAYSFNIQIKETGEIVGGIGINGVNLHHGHADFGYALGLRHRNKGYMTEAIQLALLVAFHDLKLKRVCAYVFPDNTASSHILEKLGFTLEGTARSYLKHHGRYKDCLQYSMLRDEFRVR